MTNHIKIPLQLDALGIVTIYAVFAGLWIVFSDRVVLAWTNDPARQMLAGTVKGWFFVAVTAGLLYFLMRRVLGVAEAARKEAEGRLVETEAAYAEARAARDVAHQTGAALLESEARFQLALDASNDGLWDWDYRSGATFLSLRFCEIFGLPPAPDRGFEFLQDIVIPADWPGLVAAFKSGLRGDTAFGEAEFRIRMPDGELRWIHGRGRVVDRDDAGEPLRVIGTISDITRRKLAEEGLRKISLAVEQSPASVEITDLNACIEYVNPAFLASTGYAREEMIGTNPRLLRSGKTPPETYARMWETLKRGETWKGEFVNRRKDGSEFIEFAIISPLRLTDGAVSHYVAVKEDITERKRLGAELDRYRHHLEEMVARRTTELNDARHQADIASAAKSEFLSHMSHEIRTPLNAVIGIARLLRDGDQAKQVDRLEKLELAGQHLLGIVNNVLDLSKIEAGHVEFESIDFELSRLLEYVAAMVRESAIAKGLEVKIEAADAPRWLRGDPTRLRQAMLNLASNAVKFTASGSVTLRAILEAGTAGATEVRFEVIDTGAGVAQDVAERLFQPFVQGQTGIRRQHGGTGLGLAITRRLAQLMGGASGLSNEPGRGSTFWFTACLAEGMPSAAVEASHADACAEARLRAQRISGRALLVDDDALNRMVGEETLKALGVDVDLAVNGEEAVHLVRANAYDAVLMDMQMPVMDGLDATRAIRALPGCADLPIIAMTASALAEDRKACQEAGMNDFLVKPVDRELMCAVLAKWMGRDERLAPFRQG